MNKSRIGTYVLGSLVALQVCSIAALVHDVLSVIGIFSILNKEITVTVVAVVPEEEHAEGSDVLSLDHVRLAIYAT